MKRFFLASLILIQSLLFLASTSLAEGDAKNTTKQNSAKKKEKEVFYLSPESPLNEESLDLNQALFIGETSLGFNLRNILDGTSGGNACSSCSY